MSRSKADSIPTASSVSKAVSGLIWPLSAMRSATPITSSISAREQFPGRTADAKVKALNFLLPHIRRMPNRIQRDEFAADAAQKLAIDSAILRQELKQAAAQRVESVRSHNHDPASETERILLRALVLPEDDPARMFAADQLSHHPEWYENLPSASLLEVLSHAPLRRILWMPRPISTATSCSSPPFTMRTNPPPMHSR